MKVELFAKFIIGFLVLLISQISIYAQEDLSRICKPAIINYTKQTYDAYNQNWQVAQDPKTNFMYFANSKGLLEYDGNRWNTYYLPDKQKVRSVACNTRGQIFTGGLNEFGFWEADKKGKLGYHSLRSKIIDKAFSSEEVWNIIITKNEVYFQSFAFIYRYHDNMLQLEPVRDSHLFVLQLILQGYQLS